MTDTHTHTHTHRDTHTDRQADYTVCLICACAPRHIEHNYQMYQIGKSRNQTKRINT